LPLVANNMSITNVLKIENVELRREFIDAMGVDGIFSQVASDPIDRDVDQYGNERQLLKVKMPGTRQGYIQAVRVICPTTHRVYHLLVPTYVNTCQEAVAATFGLQPEEYNPIRES